MIKELLLLLLLLRLMALPNPLSPSFGVYGGAKNGVTYRVVRATKEAYTTCMVEGAGATEGVIYACVGGLGIAAISLAFFCRASIRRLYNFNLLFDKSCIVQCKTSATTMGVACSTSGCLTA